MSFRVVGTALSSMALAAIVPMSAVSASVRPGSAVPTATASASAVNANSQFGPSRAVTPWPAYAVIAMTLALSVWIAAACAMTELGIGYVDEEKE